MGIGRLKDRGVRVISVNPVQTGYSAVADDWVSITPGTDGLLIQSLIYELLRTNQIDLDYLIRYTNASWLVIDAPGTEKHGLFGRNEDGDPQVLCRTTGQLTSYRRLFRISLMRQWVEQCALVSVHS